MPTLKSHDLGFHHTQVPDNVCTQKSTKRYEFGWKRDESLTGNYRIGWILFSKPNLALVLGDYISEAV